MQDLIAKCGDVRLRPGIAAVAAICLAAGGALAQAALEEQEDVTLPELIQSDEDLDEWEWEADEGYHEQEWYDPSDWFDDEDGIDYEYDWYEWDDNAHLYYDGYYNGYFDGYGDNRYAENYEMDSGGIYDLGYSGGYHDARYDRAQGYAGDPFYYIYVVDANAEEQLRPADRRRMQDQRREPGDRLLRLGEQRGRIMQQTAAQSRQMGRIRGTIEHLRRVPSDKYAEHVVLQIGFADGRMAVADFGPKMTQEQFPVDRGDRVTLVGQGQQRDGRPVLLVHRLNVEGDIYRISSAMPQQGNLQSAERDQPTGMNHQMHQPGNAQQVKLAGAVSGWEKAEFDSDTHKLFVLKLKNGQRKVLAFDETLSTDRLNISEGDQVELEGSETRIEGRTVVKVKRLTINGDQVQLSRR